MKWFNRWFQKKVAQAMVEQSHSEMKGTDRSYNISASLAVPKSGNSIDSEKAIRFSVQKANGGMVVETNFYDRQRDRSHHGLYIIRDDQDLGKELGKIITMESLKQ